jgi:hypothetical protein
VYEKESWRGWWSLIEFHLRPLGVLEILDFLHLVAYLDAAAHAIEGQNMATAWAVYERWLRWAWSVRSPTVTGGLTNGLRETGAAVTGRLGRRSAEGRGG